MMTTKSDDERRNRQLVELLNELRVALPGVQMLFGFLLAVPFSARFDSISNGQRNLYYLTFLATALASVCLIAPTSFHRVVWERHLKATLIRLSSVLALIGTGFLCPRSGRNHPGLGIERSRRGDGHLTRSLNSLRRRGVCLRTKVRSRR